MVERTCFKRNTLVLLIIVSVLVLTMSACAVEKNSVEPASSTKETVVEPVSSIKETVEPVSSIKETVEPVSSAKGTVVESVSSTKETFERIRPTAEEYDNWEQYRTIDKGFLNNVKNFSYDSAHFALNEKNAENNLLYSPLSLYMATAILAETASNQTQSEILTALHMNNIDLVRSQTGKLYKGSYLDNNICKMKLANSLWLNKSIDFKPDLVEKMETNYYAQSFSEDFSNEDISKKMSNWVSKNTGGKLGNNLKDFDIDPNEVSRIFNTLYFKDEWSQKFQIEDTKKADFYLNNNKKVNCDFMSKLDELALYTDGDGYLSSSIHFKNRTSMVFVLPDKGVSPYDILSDRKKLTSAISQRDDSDTVAQVTYKIPKFNFSTESKLNQTFIDLGIKLAFSPTADFSNLSESTGTYVSDVLQYTNISIDEKGCEAAAFTQICNAQTGGGCADKKIEINLNRPFIFAITNYDDIPLFIGVINNPTL